jgi:3-phosphoshikimate 1-carboxyvinyltransferase
VLIEQRDSLRGEIIVPGDKSISHRAIVFASLAKGISEIDGFLLSEDCVSTIDCLRKMQVSIEILSNNKVKVQGNGLHGLRQPGSHLNTGRSGTALRLILGVVAGQQFNSIINRDDSSQRKPVGKIVKALKNMGANIHGRDDSNLCPLSISPSRLNGITLNLSIHDTQIKSPVLIAGLYAMDATRVTEATRSRDHTELMLKHLGADIDIDGCSVIIHPVDELEAQKIEIPGDISMASYFITAGLITPQSDIIVKNVGVNPTRTGIIDVYKAMGAQIELFNEREANNEKIADIRVKYSELKAIDIEGDIIPRLLDEIPIIAVAAATANGTTTVKNLKGYKVKESGKVKLITAELAKMGVSIQETEDGLIVEGGKTLKGTVIESYNNYDIAMAMSIAGLVAKGETMIRKAQVLDIVYPDFISTLNRL